MDNHSENGIFVISGDLISKLSIEAARSERKRKNYNIHQLEDRLQRMLNAMEPDTYVRPHRHIHQPKVETFIVLRGSFIAAAFNDKGEIIEAAALDEKNNRGMDILPGVWHTILSMEKGSVFFEAKEGPYDSETDKEFPDWAPPESEGKTYLPMLKSRIFSFIESKELFK